MQQIKLELIIFFASFLSYLQSRNAILTLTALKVRTQTPEEKLQIKSLNSFVLFS